ncbi:MAG: hypothetical protein ACTHN7_04930 [Solirubrobacterales bacterium]
MDRIDEQFKRVDERFGEVNIRIEMVDRRITESKTETNKRFDRVEGDISELKKGVASVQATLNRISIGLAIAFASVLGTILAKGG